MVMIPPRFVARSAVPPAPATAGAMGFLVVVESLFEAGFVLLDRGDAGAREDDAGAHQMAISRVRMNRFFYETLRSK